MSYDDRTSFGPKRGSFDSQETRDSQLLLSEAVQWLEPFREYSVAQFIDKFFDDLCASTRERGRKLMSKFAAGEEAGSSEGGENANPQNESTHEEEEETPAVPN